MKKFTLLLVALIASLAVNAADWYISGAFQGWSHCNEAYKFTQKSAGVFELSLNQALSGEFLIVQGTTGNPDWGNKIGTNGATVKVDVPYSYRVGGNNFRMDGSVDNPTITLNTNNQTLLVSGQAQENDYDVVYLVGDLGTGWNENITNYPLTLKEGTNNTWVGEFTLGASANYFKLKAGVNVYGVNGSDQVVELGQQYSAVMPSDKSFSIGAGEFSFTFVLDKNAESGLLTVTGKGAEISSLYIIGNVNGFDGWAPDNGVAMTKDGNVFTANDVEFTASAGTANAYFSFAQKIATTPDAWSEVQGRWGASENDFEVVSGTPMSLIAGENAFTMPAGTYSVSVDMDAKTVTVTGNVIVVPDPLTSLYIIGDLEENGGFAISSGKELTADGNGSFTIENLSIYEEAETGYGFVNFCEQLGADWDSLGRRFGATENDMAVVSGQSMSLVYNPNPYSFMVEPAIYTVAVNAADMNNITVTFTKTGDLNITTELYVPESLYMIGNIDNVDWTPSKAIEMTKDGKVFSITASANLNEEGIAYFSFCEKKADVWDGNAEEGIEGINDGYRYGAPSADIILDTPRQESTPTEASLTVYKPGVDASACQSYGITGDARYTFTVDFSGTQPMLTIAYASSGVENVSVEENVPAEYFTLQGIRVANPDKGIYIRRQGSAVTKVIL